MTLTLVGIVSGFVAALALTRLMDSLLFRVSKTDPVTFIAIAFVLGAVSLIACYTPAWPATGVDPIVALRYE
jgi:putative ABC transport system permease protein